MEPNPPLRGVPVVSAIDPLLPAAPAVTLMSLEPVTTRAVDFATFYTDVRPRVGRALAVTLRDSDLAADAVDEALVRAYQRWDRVSMLDNPAGWVYRVGLNHARSRIRRLLRRPPPLQIVSAEPSITDPAIDRALAALPVDQRAVVVCRHLLGWSEAQTAEALDVRPGTVKSRLSRALTRLEHQLHHLRPEA